MNILQINTSLNGDNSASTHLAGHISTALGSAITVRDLAGEPLPHLDGETFAAFGTAPEERTPTQAALAARSDALIEELRAADTVVITAPMYNFGIPSTLKAWIDLISRAGETFRYTEDGPIGLLTNKRAIVAVASGGTEAGSEIDFATGYLKHVLGFVGITDILFVNADKMVMDGDASLARAARQTLGPNADTAMEARIEETADVARKAEIERIFGSNGR